MDSNMEGMLDTYLLETESLLDRLDELLISDEKLQTFSPEDINEIFRIMHTIKGSSAMMELHALSSVAHHIEDLFFLIREKGFSFLQENLRQTLFDLMFRSEDYLRSETEKLRTGEPLQEDTEAFSAEIRNFLEQISGTEESADAATATPLQDSSSASVSALISPEDNAAALLHIFLEEGIGMENLRAFLIVNALREYSLEFRFYPADLDSNPETAQQIVENGFFLAFDSPEAAEGCEFLLKEQPHIRSFQRVVPESSPQPSSPTPETGHSPSSAAQGTGDPHKSAAPAQTPSGGEIPQSPAPVSTPTPESAAGPAKVSSPAQGSAAVPAIRQSLISVNLQKLDSLNDLVGEIVITESMVTSSPALSALSREALDDFMKSARQLRKLTNDLQDIAMSLRMVSISAVFQKMNRIVRDMKQKLKKDVQLTLLGEDTEMDKTIIDNIQDPLMHIVRNSMDHGIEATAEERIAAGKDPCGKLVLSARQTSGEVIISVSDDGYGMDPEALLDKAEERGLLTKPRRDYSRREALELILLPGFSTNREVTEYSGRGVGMDVVKQNLNQIGGTMRIDSEQGKGSVFTLRIPLTLAILDGMKVRVGNTIFTIPIANIRQSFRMSASEVIPDETGGELVEKQGHFYPVLRLNRFYGIPEGSSALQDGIVIWVEDNDVSCCLFADELLGEQQVVVKPLPSYLASLDLKASGLNGCAILGDGSISLILDIRNLCGRAAESA